MEWKRPRLRKGERIVTRALSSLRHLHHPADWQADDFADSQRFMVAMAQGAVFPMMQCARQGGNRYRFTVWDGNHRLYALRRLGITRVPFVLFADLKGE